MDRLRIAAVIYAVAFVIHTGDHLRRGFGATSKEVVILGTVAGVFQIVAIGAVFARHRLAPILAAAVGLPDAVGIFAVHFLPHWSVLSDAFPGSHGTGVTPLSWVAGATEVVGALLFGLAGLQAMRRQPTVALAH